MQLLNRHEIPGVHTLAGKEAGFSEKVHEPQLNKERYQFPNTALTLIRFVNYFSFTGIQISA